MRVKFLAWWTFDDYNKWVKSTKKCQYFWYAKCHFLLWIVVFGDPVPTANESIDAFDKEFGIIEDAASKKQDESKLKDVEKEIQEENQKYKSGASTFYEKLNPESLLSKDEFEEEREGLVPENAQTLHMNFERRNIPGLLPVTENEKNDEENILKLEELYKSIDRDSIPASYNSKDLG